MYTVLMILGKCLTGIWLLFLPASLGVRDINRALKRICRPRRRTFPVKELGGVVRQSGNSPQGSIEPDNTAGEPVKAEETAGQDPPRPQTDHRSPNSQNSRYAALLLGLGMTTRGEIGFLIAAVSQSVDVVDSPDVYIVIIWAIILCTFLGAIGVGLVARKIKRMHQSEDSPIPILGKWG